MNKIREICRKIYFFLSIYVVLSVIKIIAKIRFFTAKPSFRQLSLNNLEEIMRRRPAKGRGSDYKYGEIDLYVRGFKRANLLLRHATSSSHNFLELGCGDGTILFHLMNMGKSVIGVDIVDWRSELVKRSGVPYIKANACNRLPFDDNSFDFVFSFASLEHFTDPEFSLREIIRVMRPLGRAYILFGPLWR